MSVLHLKGWQAVLSSSFADPVGHIVAANIAAMLAQLVLDLHMILPDGIHQGCVPHVVLGIDVHSLHKTSDDDNNNDNGNDDY